MTNMDDASAIADTLLRRAGDGFTTSTWIEENRALFRALSLEKLVTALFIGLITFVAGLNILVVLYVTVTDRARDIAVLMAMGARSAQIRKIFIVQGIAVSITGTAVGLLLGYALAWVADKRRLIPLNPEVYAIPVRPVSCERTGLSMDCRCGIRHQHRGNNRSRACRRKDSACADSPLRMIPRNLLLGRRVRIEKEAKR